jgi:hypothetical protein
LSNVLLITGAAFPIEQDANGVLRGIRFASFLSLSIFVLTSVAQLSNASRAAPSYEGCAAEMT